jgi:hypothetical protein
VIAQGFIDWSPIATPFGFENFHSGLLKVADLLFGMTTVT